MAGTGSNKTYRRIRNGCQVLRKWAFADIRSMRQTILYGLKGIGISAYGHQARELGYYSDQADEFYIQALEAITDDSLTVEDIWTKPEHILRRVEAVEQVVGDTVFPVDRCGNKIGWTPRQHSLVNLKNRHKSLQNVPVSCGSFFVK